MQNSLFNPIQIRRYTLGDFRALISNEIDFVSQLWLQVSTPGTPETVSTLLCLVTTELRDYGAVEVAVFTDTLSSLTVAERQM